jgi:hypothetical protein
VEESEWFDNMILDSGLNSLGATQFATFNSLQVGTGTAVVTAGQTKLAAYNAGTSLVYHSSTGSGDPLYKMSHLYQAVFPQGAVVGNITEIGVGPDQDNVQNLFSRALIVDSNNVAISMAVIAMDQLTVFYKLTVTPPLTTSSGSLVIAGVTYGYTSKIALVESFSNGYFLSQYSDFFSLVQSVESYSGQCSLGAVNETITGDYIGGSNAGVHVSYTPSTKTRVSRISFSIDQGNSNTGITGFVVNYQASGSYQYVLNKPIPKDNTKVLSLDISFSWSRG